MLDSRYGSAVRGPNCGFPAFENIEFATRGIEVWLPGGVDTLSSLILPTRALEYTEPLMAANMDVISTAVRNCVSIKEREWEEVSS